MKKNLPLAFAFVLLVLTSCTTPKTVDTRPQVTVTTKAGDTHIIYVQIAKSERDIQKGLMDRDHLAEDSGMLFLFAKPAVWQFWMKDIYIPLDILFIDANGRVIKIKANAPPQDWTAIGSGKPVLAVLEIPGGRAKALGITVGSTVDYADPE